MKTYTFEDMTHAHNVNEMADKYQRAGAIAIASLKSNWTVEQYWHVHDVTEILRPLDDYKSAHDYIGCSIGVERFAWMNFKQGWNAGIAKVKS